MITLNITIENLDELRDNFKKSPSTMLKYLSQAVAASIFTIEKHSTDTNFQFKTPRGLRTGYLEQSFSFGKKIMGLRGSIGPTATYAPYVYFGTSRGIQPNRYMERIVDASEREVGAHFKRAIQSAVADIART